MSLTADIRNYTASLLTSAGIAGGNILNSKVMPTYHSQMPAVLVYIDKVDATQFTAHSPTWRQSIDLQLVCLVSAVEGWADQADALATEVLDACFTDPTWVQQFKAIENYTVQYALIGDQQQNPLGAATITISAFTFKAYSPAL